MQKLHAFLFICSSFFIQSAESGGGRAAKKINGNQIANRLIMHLERWALSNAKKYIAQADKVPGWFHDIIILEAIHGYFTHENEDTISKNELVIQKIFQTFWTDQVDVSQVRERCTMYKATPDYNWKHKVIKKYMRRPRRTCLVELENTELYKLAKPSRENSTVHTAYELLSERSLQNIYKNFIIPRSNPVENNNLQRIVNAAHRFRLKRSTPEGPEYYQDKKSLIIAIKLGEKLIQQIVQQARNPEQKIAQETTNMWIAPE